MCFIVLLCLVGTYDFDKFNEDLNKQIEKFREENKQRDQELYKKLVPILPPPWSVKDE
jgi:hypothetical protein